MKIFMTGVSGFIGSHIAVELLRQGHSVVGLARNKNKVPGLMNLDGLEIVQGALSDRELLRRLVAGKDACVHVALDYTKSEGWEVLLDDTLPAVYLAGIAAEADVKHFIYTSSTAVNDSLYEAGIDRGDETTSTVGAHTKQRPATFYGATKAASENFLIAQSYRSPLRVTIIRPGYTFGNPAVTGAPTQADGRFSAIVARAFACQSVVAVKNDGTQFIWAGDLARVFAHVLQYSGNRKTYFALSRSFISWEAIAREAILQCGSTSELIVEDRGYRENGLRWDVSGIKQDFGLEFEPWEKIREHLSSIIALQRGKAT
jgi:UDP-glucose 4-epimerase